MAANIGTDDIPKISAKDIGYDKVPIGRGGYGYVYRGLHKEMGTVAIKTMIADGLLPARHLRIFKSEGKKLWQLQHPSIVKLLGLIMEENNYSLILEYMHFGSLTAFRTDFRDIHWSLLVSIVRDVVSGMVYLHHKDPPILHLDLKSDNILINRRIRAKITDFGLSQWKTMTRTMTHSQGGAGEDKGRKGTVTHVPPEVWNNINTAPNKAYDIYSFAIVLWEAMTGDRPFGRVSDDVIPKAVLSGQRPDLTMIPSECPQQIVKMMTKCWTQQPDKRPDFPELQTEINVLFETLAPSVPAALSKLETEIQNLYDPEDIGGDTAATADSETLYDAASKLTQPLPGQTPSVAGLRGVQMEDVGEDTPMTAPKGTGQSIVGLQDKPVPSTSSRTSGPSASGAQSSETSGGTSQAPPPAATRRAGHTPGGQEFLMTEEEKKALRRVLRDPVGMMLMQKDDARLCSRLFGVEPDFQKKIRESGQLLRFLEQDPLLRMELQRKGAQHMGWLFHPQRMKDDIRKKRPARTPKPEAVDRLKRLKEEREEREKKESQEQAEAKEREESRKEKKGGLAGLMGRFRKDKGKKDHPMMPRHMDPYMDPMAELMAMKMGRGMGGMGGMNHDLRYKLKRALRDYKMIRYILREEEPPRISPVDKEIMDIIRDPDRLLEVMNDDPQLMDILVSTDKDAFMKLMAIARGGGIPRSKHLRDSMSSRSRGTYGGLERDMMDMDLEDEMMMMRDHDRYNKFDKRKQEKSVMEALRKPGIPSEYSSSGSTSTSKSSSKSKSKDMTSKGHETNKSTTGAVETVPSGKEARHTTATTSPSTTTTTTTTTTTKTNTSTKARTSSLGSSVDKPSSETSRSTSIEPEMRDMTSLPDDHLLKRQDNVKMSVQRNTDTEPLKTAYGNIQDVVGTGATVRTSNTAANTIDMAVNTGTINHTTSSGAAHSVLFSDDNPQAATLQRSSDSGSTSKMSRGSGGNTTTTGVATTITTGRMGRREAYQSKWKKMSKKHRSAGRYSHSIEFTHVNLVAEQIGNKWMDLADNLRMDDDKLRELKVEFKMNHEKDSYDFCVRVLDDVLNRNTMFDLRSLISTLKTIKCDKIAIMLMKYVE